MMGAIVAVASKKGENVVPDLITALSTLLHRGADAHGVGIHNTIRISKSLETLSTEKLNSSLAIGHNFSRMFLKDKPQPILGGGFSFVFEGRLLPPPTLSRVEEVLRILKSDPQGNAEKIIHEFDGFYVFAVACRNRLLVGRDMMGAASLYYGENESIAAVASERKALWKINIANVKSFPPGSIVELSHNGFFCRTIRVITQPPVQPLSMNVASAKLQSLLLEATREQVSNIEEVSVAFSGGLDSSVVALLAKVFVKKVSLITVCVGSQFEAQHAKVVADELGLFHHLQIYTLKDVEELLPKILWLIEERDLVKVSIAIPFYWVAEIASKLGSRILLAGQGADELFGGYQKYLKTYAESGEQEVQNAVFHDTELCYERNLQRDSQICSYHGIELRLPFIDPKVVKFALGLPVKLKLGSPEDSLRKKALRQTAQNLGLSLKVAFKTKKAIQYSTGVDKALRKLARNRGLSTNEYVKDVFEKVYPYVI